MSRLKIKKSIEMDDNNSQIFDMLESNLLYYGGEAKTIAFTSCRDKEGKSFISIRTASALAAQKNKVLLLLADFRKTLGDGTRSISGILEVIENRIELDKVIFETDIDNMYMIFSGDSTEEKNKVIDVNRYTEVMSALKEKFDYIIVDMSTVGKTVNDAIIFSQCDAAVIVLEPNQISRKLMRHVKRIIEEAGCMLLGMVMNTKSDKL